VEVKLAKNLTWGGGKIGKYGTGGGGSRAKQISILVQGGKQIPILVVGKKNPDYGTEMFSPPPSHF